MSAIPTANDQRDAFRFSDDTSAAFIEGQHLLVDGIASTAQAILPVVLVAAAGGGPIAEAAPMIAAAAAPALAAAAKDGAEPSLRAVEKSVDTSIKGKEKAAEVSARWFK